MKREERRKKRKKKGRRDKRRMVWVAVAYVVVVGVVDGELLYRQFPGGDGGRIVWPGGA